LVPKKGGIQDIHYEVVTKVSPGRNLPLSGDGADILQISIEPNPKKSLWNRDSEPSRNKEVV
jgi:hypothetical protein